MCIRDRLSGRRPRESSKIEDLLFMLLNEPPTPIVHRVPQIAPALAAIVDKAIASDRTDRYETADQMRLDLEEFLESDGN